MSNSLSYNAVDLGGVNYGFIVEENDFVNPPQPRINRDALAMADGDAAQGATFGALVGVVKGVVSAASYTALHTQRDNIAGALAAGQEGVKALTFDAISGKSWNARVLGTSWSNETPITIDLAITFYAPDPWPEATSATTAGPTSISGSPTTL